MRGILNKYFNYDEYYKKYEKVCSQYNNEKTENVAMYFQIPMNKKRCVWHKKDFEDVVYLQFEFLTVPVPSGYIDILDRFYGNWHEYVRGTSIHGGVIFDVNISYDQFLRKE